MKEPLTCLERVRSVTGEVAVIETLALHLQGMEDQKLLQFYAGGEVNQDFGNWYAPTMSALHALCLAAGFSSVRTIQGPPAGPTPKPPSFQDRLGRRLQSTEHRGQVSPPSTYYRAIVHAVI
jgi:hypothetical protein